MLVTDPDGQIIFPSDKGLFFRDTRLISSWSVFANGIEWDLLTSGNVTHHASRSFLTNAAFSTEDGDIPPHVLGWRLAVRWGVAYMKTSMSPTMDPSLYGSIWRSHCDVILPISSR